MTGIEGLKHFTFLHAQRPARLEIICEMLRVYNCRVSEILKAEWCNFYEGKFLILRGAKRSKDIDIRDRQILQSITTCPKLHPQYIFGGITYSQVYNFILKNYSHLLSNEYTIKNRKITHYFRYANSKQIKTVKDAKTILHHNSKKSCGYYNHKLKEE